MCDDIAKMAQSFPIPMLMPFAVGRFSHLEARSISLPHMTCFGQWDISKCDVSRSIQSVCNDATSSFCACALKAIMWIKSN